MEDANPLKPDYYGSENRSSPSTVSRTGGDLPPPTGGPVSAPDVGLCTSSFDTTPQTYSFQDLHVDDSGLFMEHDEPFLDDLTSFLEGGDVPCDLSLDPIEDRMTIQTSQQHVCDPMQDSSRTTISTEFDDLLDMVVMADNYSNETKKDVLQYWADSEVSELYPDNGQGIVHDLFPASFPSLFDDTSVLPPCQQHHRQAARSAPSSTSVSGDQHQSAFGSAGQGGVIGQPPHVPSFSAGEALVKRERRVATSTATSATASSINGDTVSQQDQKPTEDSSVSSTSPDFPSLTSDLPVIPAAQDDPYFPLPALEVILMSPEARFMHLVQSLCRDFPAELHRFMLAVSGDRGITPPPSDGQVMSVKSMLELRREIEQIRPVDTLLLERIITENEHGLARHESILKEVLRITCHGDMSQWEEKLVWGREERKRLQEEADNAAPASVLTRCCSVQNTGDPSLGALGDVPAGQAFGLDDVADDVSVTSFDSDTEPDQTDLPQAFCYPKGPDLLRSNRDVAHPHLEAPVADSVCQTQFGKVKFSVYPGIRWGRDPLRKKKRLERKLNEAAKDGEADIFICDDLLETLDMDSSVDELLDCLTQHNLRCPKATEWHRSRATVALERGICSYRGPRPATSHLIIRKMADGTPFFEGGQRAPPRTMDKEEFLSQLADGRMTLAGQPPERYNQLLVRRPETGGGGARDGAADQHRGSELGAVRPAVSCASLPSQQEISFASQVAKDLLSRQTRDLYRSSLLRSAKPGASDAKQFGRTSKNAFLGYSDKTRTTSAQKLSGSDSHKLFTTSFDASKGIDGHWKSLMDSVYQPRSLSRSATSSERKRSLDSDHDTRQKKQHSSRGSGRSHEAPKPAKTDPLPTILLQSVPLFNVSCQQSSSGSRKSSSVKQPLLLPKPTVAISSDTIHGSIAMQGSGCSGGEKGSFSARLSRGYDSFLGVAQRRALRVAGLVTGAGRSKAAETSPGQDGGGLVRLEPEPAELERGADSGGLAGEQNHSDAEGSRRTVTEPPSPKSLQARDKILRAMVSMADDTDDVTSMHYHRPRHCDFRSLTIGGFRLEPAGGRGQLKIIYSARKIVYEFDYPPVSEESERRQLVNIEVKFSGIIALQSSTEELSIVVCQIPAVLVGRPSSGLASQRARLQNAGLTAPGAEVSSADPRLRRLVNGDIRDSPLHQLQLTPGGCEAACRTLGRVSHRFHSMLCWPPQLDGYVPRWQLVPCSDAIGTAPGTGGACSRQETSGAWLQSPGPKSCSCQFSCRSLDCPCSRSSLPCGYNGSQCGCGATCANTFNALLDEGVDVETAREDTCLVQNVFAVNKPREIRRLLSDSQPCPHCHLPVEIRTAVPMQRPCTHCAKPVVFSWCQRKLRHSRNHCLVCIGCSDVNFQHCLVCKFCTRRTHQRGPCTQCLARSEQWRGHRRYVTAEGRRFSRQLMTEMKLTPSSGAEEGQRSPATEGEGPPATV